MRISRFEAESSFFWVLGVSVPAPARPLENRKPHLLSPGNGRPRRKRSGKHHAKHHAKHRPLFCPAVQRRPRRIPRQCPVIRLPSMFRGFAPRPMWDPSGFQAPCRSPWCCTATTIVPNGSVIRGNPLRRTAAGCSVHVERRPPGRRRARTGGTIRGANRLGGKF